MLNVHFKKTLTGTAMGILLLSIAACARQTLTQVPLTTPTYPVPQSTSPPDTRAAPGASAPATAEQVVALIDNNPSLQTLAQALDKADLENMLGEDGPYTIFAPSDLAFASLPAATRERLLQDENRSLLRQILTYHVISGQIYANQLQSGELVTEAGSSINIDVDGSQVKVNEAQIVEPDLKATNGVVHIVDRIILPPNVKLNPSSVLGVSQIAIRSIIDN
jgi:uncharacterized surface protein with fasciclin (FAS1) repeats